MNFENIRADLELKLSTFVEFELVEFHYQTYCFGSGILSYRVNGVHHKFIYDGKDNVLIWLRSKKHQKYSNAKFTEYRKFNEQNISEEELLKGINEESF